MRENTLNYGNLDVSKIRNRIVGSISLEESLKDISPISWSNEVLEGKKKVVIGKEK